MSRQQKKKQKLERPCACFFFQNYNISFTWVIKYIAIVVLEWLHPSAFFHVQFFFNTEILKAFMIRIQFEFGSVKIVSLNLQGKNQCCKLQITSRIILLVRLQLSRGLSYYFVPLGKDTSQSNLTSITENCVVVGSFLMLHTTSSSIHQKLFLASHSKYR